ncbi:beta-alanine-activating enzyme [Anopheles marshallii]|uniref:beta-alanine-activating enzyme n=1 Tax=Anopheles marshallii TaxID=1521116 RepID=UPI00237A7E4D|nr:beta-alanine-activating enzyme [Anopheles marshallii]
MELIDKGIFKTFSKQIAIRYYNSSLTISEINYEQLWSDMKKVARVLKEQNIAGKIVGVQLHHCPALIAVIGGIIISGNCFYCIDSQAVDRILPEYGLCAAFFLENLGPNRMYDGLQMLLGLRILTLPLMLLLDLSRVESYPDFAFCVTTSGSTGRPKTVLVPKACIMPNVLSLSDRFELCERDVIFVCSPPTFDPFVVDILMGLHAGATLLLVDNSIRLSATRLLSLLFPGVTVMQMTPSIFTRWKADEMEHIIFGSQTTLRILVLGGEQFPMLKKPAECLVTVYNIYGITEVSCWSMIQKVSPENGALVALGEPLDRSIMLQLRSLEDESLKAETNMNGSTIGHLYIGSCSRKCFILGKNNENDDTLGDERPIYRPTGDVVELTKEGNYYYRDRCKRTIKRFGCRVSLSELEAVVHRHSAVQQCAACFISEHHRLLLFYTTDNDDRSIQDTIWNELRAKLRPEKLPDELHRIEQIPLSSHGKVCAKGLERIYENLKLTLADDRTSAVDYFRAELSSMGIAHEHACERHNVKDNGIKKLKPNSSFIDRGGTSFAALRLHNTLEEKFKVQLPQLITLLIDPSIPLEMALKYVESKVSGANTDLMGAHEKSNIPNDHKLTIVKQYNLEKCVDSRPSITFCPNVGYILTIGSHSGMLLTINTDTDAVLSCIVLPDRVECGVSFFTTEENVVYGTVGCYDGFLYCFNPLDGSIAWKYDAGAMIKCTPLVLPRTNLIIFGSYSNNYNLHCIVGGQSSPILRWKVQVGNKPIFSQPLSLGDNVDAGLILAATLDGTMAALSVATGHLAWKQISPGNIPIFSTPAFLPAYKRIACCTVDGSFGIYDAIEGIQIAKHKFPGNIFSSFEILQQSHDHIHFIVGCYDRKVHCIEYVPLNGETLLPKWNIEIQSQIYATPCLVGQYLVVCSTSGWINLIDLNEVCDANLERNITAAMKMKGELFSTPLSCGTVVFVGCRDNFLYKICVNV